MRLQKKYFVKLLRFFYECHEQCNYSILTLTQSRKGCGVRIENIVANLERKNKFLFRKGKSKVQIYLEITRLGLLWIVIEVTGRP